MAETMKYLIVMH